MKCFPTLEMHAAPGRFSSQELSPLEGRGYRIYIYLKPLRSGEPKHRANSVGTGLSIT